MASEKYDGVIEAVRYSPEGEIHLVRVYERRGPIFSDRLLLSREALVERLKAGKVFVAGRRIAQLGGSFDVFGRVRLVQTDARLLVASDGEPATHDHLKDVPLF